MPKKIPKRQCVACRQHFDKRSLGRVVKKPDGTIVFDKTGKVSGRGAYVCLNKECFKKAVRSKALQRALECTISEDTIKQIEQEIEDGQ